MSFNFKKNNLLIILLLVLVIMSCICYFTILNDKEGFTNHSEYFTKIKEDTNYNYFVSNNLYLLNPSLDYSDSSTISTTIFDNDDISIKTDFMINNKYDYLISTNLNYYFYKLNTNSSLNINLQSNLIDVTDLSSIEFVFKTGKDIDNSNLIYNLNNDQNNSLLNLTIDGSAIIIDGKIQDVNIQDNTSNTSNVTEASNNNLQNELFKALLNFNNNKNKIQNELVLDNIMQNNKNSPFYNNELFAYMLPGNTNTLAGLNNYNSPLYNNFETAMNMPSNPILNPVNSMNCP